ncbi:MAG: hypothetical protein CMJ81_22295 [Planctomycetaceae bacterium]|jgi:hypothetical protein|nr:hypothetical protein [Planctomycetaceae bacterium]MBP60531.1 hypothetical protein [Planctomycetaceae bacterium]
MEHQHKEVDKNDLSVLTVVGPASNRRACRKMAKLPVGRTGVILIAPESLGASANEDSLVVSLPTCKHINDFIAKNDP